MISLQLEHQKLKNIGGFAMFLIKLKEKHEKNKQIGPRTTTNNKEPDFPATPFSREWEHF